MATDVERILNGLREAEAQCGGGRVALVVSAIGLELNRQTAERNTAILKFRIAGEYPAELLFEIDYLTLLKFAQQELLPKKQN